jgi:hypothetical protein
VKNNEYLAIDSQNGKGITIYLFALANQHLSILVIVHLVHCIALLMVIYFLTTKPVIYFCWPNTTKAHCD